MEAGEERQPREDPHHSPEELANWRGLLLPLLLLRCAEGCAVKASSQQHKHSHSRFTLEDRVTAALRGACSGNICQQQGLQP